MSEVPGTGGSFIVIGVSQYDHHRDLEHVGAEVPKLRALLTGFAFADGRPGLAGAGTFEEVYGLIRQGPPADIDPLIIYWAGHGEREVSGEYLLVKDSPKHGFHGFNAVSARTLGELLATWPIRQAMVVIDTCYAQQMGNEIAHLLGNALSQQTFPHGSPGITIIASCGPFERPPDGHFLERFIKILRHGGDSAAWATGSSRVSPLDLVAALNEGYAEARRPEAHVRTIGVPKPILPNPRAVPGLPAADVDTQRRRQRFIHAHGMGGHFDFSARGIEVDETGWFFVGRERVQRELLRWLESGEGGLRVVTGSPGSGKSAVLGRIATLSDPEYRRLAQAEGALRVGPGTPLPPLDLIDVALHAKNKSLAQCWDALADGLGIPTPAGGWRTSGRLIEAVATREGPTRIIVDALDEARPDAVLALATDLLRPLAASGGVQLVVGSRSHAVGTAPEHSLLGQGPLITALTGVSSPERVIVLDHDERTVRDIETYVALRLAQLEGSPYRGDHAAAGAVAAAVAEASGQIFLFARIVTRALAGRAQPLRLGTAEARTFLGGSVRDVFAADLRRFGADEVRARDLLAPLAWAEGAGFPRRGVWPAVATALAPSGARYDESDVDWLLDQAGYHVTETSEDGQAVYRLYHEAYAEYFRAELTGRP